MTKEFSEFMNRRKFVRVNIHALVKYCVPNESIPEIIQTRISDISEGGVLMVTFMKGLYVDALIKMSFVAPGTSGQLVIVEGRVRHTRSLEKDLYESGVEFLDLEKKDQLIIRGCVASLPKK